MGPRSLAPRLTDIVEAVERIQAVLAQSRLDLFESDWQKQWLVERGVEIISEASRHLTEDVKARHPDIPWRKVAGIGNLLRHNYERIAAPSCGNWRKTTCQRSRRFAERNAREPRD